MNGSYWTLVAAMALGFRGGESLVDAGTGPRRTRLGIWVMALVLALLGTHVVTSHLLRFWWGVSGVVLIGEAIRLLTRGEVRQSWWTPALDVMGALVGLWLSGADLTAVVAGVASGFLLPIGLGPWLRRYLRISGALGAVMVGGVGLKNLTALALSMPLEHYPTLLWSVPWLMAWDLWVAASGAKLRWPTPPVK